MKLTVIAIGLALAGCKKPAGKQNAAPGSGGSGAVRANVTGDAGDASGAGSGLVFEPPENMFDGVPDPMEIAFGNRAPRLPAVSADGTMIAELDSEVSFSGPPDPPIPWEVRIYKLGADTPTERFPILASEYASANAGSDWATPALTKTVKAHGQAVLARLKGFRSLEPLKADGELVKIGDLTLTTASTDDAVVVELRDAKQNVLQRLEQPGYSTGGGDDACSYTPVFGTALRDASTRTVYYHTAHHYRDDCEQPDNKWIAWSLDPAAADPRAAIAGMVAHQFDLVGDHGPDVGDLCVDSAPIVTNGAMWPTSSMKLIGGVDNAMDYSGAKAKDIVVTLSRDGKSAWASETASIALLETNKPGRDIPWRASDVAIKTAAGWRFAALAWTEPVANGKANSDAKSGKLKASKLEDDPGDQGLRDAFAKLTTDGIANPPDNLVAIGSGPGERTVNGPAFARAWAAAWKGKVSIISSVGRLLPSGTTGWVAATIEAQKPGYKLPFTVFAVFDKDASGAWQLVHIHFAV